MPNVVLAGGAAADPAPGSAAATMSYGDFRKKAGRSSGWKKRKKEAKAKKCSVPGCPGKPIGKPIEGDHMIPMKQMWDRYAGKLTVDQMVELHNMPQNVVPLCRSHNGSRQNKTYTQWTRRKGLASLSGKLAGRFKSAVGAMKSMVKGFGV